MQPPFEIKRFIVEQRQYPLVWLVVFLCFIPFTLFTNLGLNGISSWFMPSQLTIDNSWKLLTPSFVHYTFVHLLTNLIVWWLLATKIEPNSTRDFLLFFIFSAAFSNSCQWLVTGSEFGGLSGVNYALLGYLLVGEKVAGIKAYRLDPVLVGLLILLIPLGFSEQFGKFANYAHLGGLFVGALLAFINLLIFKKKI